MGEKVEALYVGCNVDPATSKFYWYSDTFFIDEEDLDSFEIICRTMGKTPQEVRKSCINAMRSHCEFARRRYAKAVKALDEYRRENENGQK